MDPDARVPQSSRDLGYPRAHLVRLIVVAISIAKNQIQIFVGSLNTTAVLLVPAVPQKNIQRYRR
jgi:hypothetical protein